MYPPHPPPPPHPRSTAAAGTACAANKSAEKLFRTSSIHRQTQQSTSILYVGRSIVAKEGISALFRGVLMRSFVLGVGSVSLPTNALRTIRKMIALFFPLSQVPFKKDFCPLIPCPFFIHLFQLVLPPTLTPPHPVMKSHKTGQPEQPTKQTPSRFFGRFNRRSHIISNPIIVPTTTSTTA